MASWGLETMESHIWKLSPGWPICGKGQFSTEGHLNNQFCWRELSRCQGRNGFILSHLSTRWAHGFNWSQVALAHSSLKQGFGSRPDTEVGPWQWECWTPVTMLVISDRVLAFLLCRESPQEQKVVKQVKYLVEEKEYMWINTWADSESHPCASLNHLYEPFLPVSFR